MKNFYDLLTVPSDAPVDEIKKAFRREIARYHPDKVQHLGKEFQDMASGIAADLTEAYRILMDPMLRDRYNEDLFGDAATGAPAPRPAAGHPPPVPPSPSSSSSASSAEPSSSTAGNAPPPRPSSQAGVDFVRKASLSRLRSAIEEILGAPDAPPPAGFDIAVTSKPKRGLFKKADDKVRLVVRFVPLVDGEAVAEAWPNSLKHKVADSILCVLLVGPGLAPSKDLSAAISEQRRKTRPPIPVLVPVDVRDWEALFPPDTPAPVRSLVQRLKDEQR